MWFSFYNYETNLISKGEAEAKKRVCCIAHGKVEALQRSIRRFVAHTTDNTFGYLCRRISRRRAVGVTVGHLATVVAQRVAGGNHPAVGDVILGPPSHEVGPWEPELGREPLVGVLGSLGSCGGEPHAQLVHHAWVEAVLGYEWHSDVTTLKEDNVSKIALFGTVGIAQIAENCD